MSESFPAPDPTDSITRGGHSMNCRSISVDGGICTCGGMRSTLAGDVIVSASVAPTPSAAWFCDRAKSLVGGDRKETYGDAAADFTRTGKMWAAVLGLDEVTAEQVALCMALVKIGRLCHTPNHEDSWVDIVGYAALGGQIASTPGRYL